MASSTETGTVKAKILEKFRENLHRELHPVNLSPQDEREEFE